MDHENFNRLVEIMGCLDLLHKYAIDEKSSDLSDDSESDSSDVSRQPYVTTRGSIKSPKAKKPTSDSDDSTPSRRSANFKLAYKSRKRASLSSSDDDDKKQTNPTHYTHLTHPLTSPPNRQHIISEQWKRSPLSSPPSPSHSASPPCPSTAQSGTLISLTPRSHNSHRSSVDDLHTPAVYLRTAESVPTDGAAGKESSQMGLNSGSGTNSVARHSVTSITSNKDLLKPIRTKKERRPLLSHLTEWSGIAKTQSEGTNDGRRVSAVSQVSGVSQVSQVSQVRQVRQVSEVSGGSEASEARGVSEVRDANEVSER
eukprot:GHVN01005945.1.p1 GENE.GHVN01005945.1~~GHVN01005945.1.p1  ORF type:complete len:313 (-),score=111.67 GHVN01005945.1:1-939(-)